MRAAATVLVAATFVAGCSTAMLAQEAPPRRLNNFVVELADIDLTQPPDGPRELSLTLESECWLHIALEGEGPATVALRAVDTDRVVLDAPGETMRHVDAGDVALRLAVDEGAAPERLTVRRVPEIMVYMFEGLKAPDPQRWITHSWETMESAVLHSANLIVSPPSEDYAEHARAWQERGGRWLINQGMSILRQEETDGAHYWANLLRASPWDGVIHDEVLDRDRPNFERYGDDLARFSAMPEAEGKTVYLFCGSGTIGDPTLLDFFSPDDETAADGQRSIRCVPQGEQIVTARQMEVELEPGVEHTISAWMRTEGCVPATYSGVFVIDEGWHHRYGNLRPPEGDGDWTRYERSFTPEPSRNGLYQVILCGPADGDMWVDAVQIERGGQATEFASAEPNVLRNASFEQGLSAWMRGADEPNPLRDAVIQHGHAFAPEVYMHEQPTEEKARELIERRLVRVPSSWSRYYEGMDGRALIVLSAGNCALRYSNDQHPDVSYKALLDLQMQALATGKGLEGLRGVGFWSGHYIDEEGLRWYGALFRHYCIEGATSRLSEDPYMLDHLTNPGFEQSLEGWEAIGSVEAVPIGEMPDGGARGRYAPVPEGAMAVRTVREGEEANSLSQPIRNLEPGRLYSLKLYCTDPQYSDRLIPASIEIEGGELLPERTLDHVWRVEEIRWTMHYRVFRATAAEGRLTIADVEPGEVYWDFVQIEPWFEG